MSNLFLIFLIIALIFLFIHLYFARELRKVDAEIDEELDRLEEIYSWKPCTTFTTETLTFKRKFKRDFTKRFYPKRIKL